MKFECPVCGSKLHHERVDDGTIIVEVNEDGTTGEEILNVSNGYDRVHCSGYSGHNIPDKLVLEIICLA